MLCPQESAGSAPGLRESLQEPPLSNGLLCVIFIARPLPMLEINNYECVVYRIPLDILQEIGNPPLTPGGRVEPAAES